MAIAVAAVKSRHIVTVDNTGAYLECDLAKEEEVYMDLDPLLTRMLCLLDPSAKGFVGDNGKLCVMD